MLLKITHTTDLDYSEPISESVMELRMVPRQAQDQHRLAFDLAIGPAAAPSTYYDWLGNTVHAFTINALHDQIRIVATSIVETDRAAPEPAALADVWPLQLREADYALHDFLEFGGPVVDSPLLRAAVEQLYPYETIRIGELAGRMVKLIENKFFYKPGVTTAASPITEMLQHGSGVCQDFTHLMIGMARALRIPARYVSGYLHPESARFRGHTQTHAWAELFFPSTGWIGFDPANRCVIGEHFVKVAIGRDFRDVPPNKGLYRGAAAETIDVKVHSEPLASIPPELAAEKIAPLAVRPAARSAPASSPASPTAAPQQSIIQHQDQQQQQ
jgi:transglutaminase-like putative cysteine protease